MSMFFMFGKYTQDACKGISGGRTEEVKSIVKNCGGTVKEIYATLGEHDLVIIADLPTNADAVKCSIDITKMTGIGFTSAPAISAEEFDAACGS